MGDPVVVESWHLPSALSDEALRLLTSLPMDEIERRLRMVEPAGNKSPTDKDILQEPIDIADEEILAEHSHDVVNAGRRLLARWGAAPQAADEEVAELVAALDVMAVEADRACQLSDADVITCAANLLQRQAAAAPVARLPEDAQVIEPANRTILVPVPAPIPVSERLPGPEDCDAEGRCWWGDAGDDQFVPSWRLCEQPDDTHFAHWLPAHALPLPEFDHE